MFEIICGGGSVTDCRTAATALPGVDTLAVLAAATPAGLSAAGLVDAVIAAERLLAHVNGLQVRLLAELGRPNRCADVSGWWPHWSARRGWAAVLTARSMRRGRGGDRGP